MKTYTTIYVVFIILFFVEYANCHRCHNKCRHFLTHHSCPVLVNKNCEIVRRFCGCCDECALNLDEKCSANTPRCASGLMCVNSKGEALKIVHHSLKDYVGFCQNVFSANEGPVSTYLTSDFKVALNKWKCPKGYESCGG